MPELVPEPKAAAKADAKGKGKGKGAPAKGKPKAGPKAKPKAKADAGPPDAPIVHQAMACDTRGDGKGMLRYDWKRQKLSAHCQHPAHGALCRMQRSLEARASNAAGTRMFCCKFILAMALDVEHMISTWWCSGVDWLLVCSVA